MIGFRAVTLLDSKSFSRPSAFADCLEKRRANADSFGLLDRSVYISAASPTRGFNKVSMLSMSPDCCPSIPHVRSQTVHFYLIRIEDIFSGLCP